MKPNLFSEKALMEKAERWANDNTRLRQSDVCDWFDLVRAFRTGEASKVSELRELLEKKIDIEAELSTPTKIDRAYVDGGLSKLREMLIELGGRR